MRILYNGAVLFSSDVMATRKLGQLCGVDIVRVMNPVGVRVRCEFVSLKHPFVEFEMAGDLALGIAKELEMLLALKSRKKKTTTKTRRQRAPSKPRAKRASAATRG
jgi:hypothetical protein